jgi:hypothetical protein
MDKPEFIINQATGKKLMQWCSLGLSLEEAKVEIDSCTSVEGLRHLYTKYTSIQTQIHPLLLERKEVLENINNQIINKENIVEPSK